MGVWFDYFRAPDDSTAAAVLGRLAGPRDLDAPPMDVVLGKGFDSWIMLPKLQSLLTGIPDAERPSEMLVAMADDEGPWVVRLSEGLRDALADAEADRLPGVAEQWVRTEEFTGLWDGAAAAEVLPFLGGITALARRARQAGERLYCWITL